MPTKFLLCSGTVDFQLILTTLDKGYFAYFADKGLVAQR